MPDLHEINLSNILEIRKAIQAAGAEIYNSFHGLEKNIAGEFMALNENYVWYEVNAAGGLTVGCEEILKTGYTKNQRDWLAQLYHNMQMWDHIIESISQFPENCTVHTTTGKRSGRFVFSGDQHKALVESGGEYLLIVHKDSSPFLGFRAPASCLDLPDFTGNRAVSWRVIVSQLAEVV